MRKFLFLIILIISAFSFNLVGQDDFQTKLDSTIQAIEKYEVAGDIEAQCESYLDIAHAYVTVRDYENLEKYLMQGKAILPSNASDMLKGKYLTKEGLLESSRDFVKSEALFKQAIPLLENQSDQMPMADLWKEYASLFTAQHKSEQALEMNLKALDIFHKNPEVTKGYLPLLFGISTSYRLQADFDNALKYIREGLEFAKEKNMLRDQGYFYNQQSVLFSDLEEKENAEDALYKSYEAFKKAKTDPWMVHLVLGNIGSAKVKRATETQDLQLLDEAEENFSTAYNFFEEIGDSIQMSYIDYYMVNLLNSKGAYEKSEALLKEIIAFQKDKKPTRLCDAYLALGNVYKTTGKIEKAKIAYINSLEVAKEINFNRQIKDLNRFLYELEKKQGNFEKALVYHEDYARMKDSLYDEKANIAIQKERVNQQLDEVVESKEKAELKASLLSSRNKLFGTIAAGLAGILLIGGYLYNRLRKIQIQLASQNQQLQDLNTTKDKFFGIIAHDIRSPITALDGVSEQMNYYLEKDDKSKLNRLANRIDTTAKRLTSLLDNLLNWALLQTGMIPYNPKSVDIQAVAQENIDLFQPVAEAKNISLKNNISDNCSVYSDESALNTIIRNLVNNAIKFTPAGGEVSIDTEEKGDKVFIKINDTGTGIAADKLEKIFSREKQSSKGTAGEKGSGLGLMLCKELVELNKGTIQAISEVGKGSSFIFSLPKV